MFNPTRRQRQTIPLRMLPSTSARIAKSVTDSTSPSYLCLVTGPYTRLIIFLSKILRVFSSFILGIPASAAYTGKL